MSEAAVFACSSAVQIFVKDLATKMQQQAVEGVGLTPAELKKSVLACGELNFLRDKVVAIDESDAKYHKPARGGKKRTRKTSTMKSPSKKARTAKAKSTESAATATASLGKKAQLAGKGKIHSDDALAVSVTGKPTTPMPKARALDVEEDDDYDESDSDA